MTTDDAYLRRRAWRRVKAVKGFYIHLSAYVAVNAYLVFSQWASGSLELSALWVPVGWGVGIAAHALGVFGTPFRFVNRWEQRKVDELVEREKHKRSSGG